MMNACSFRKKAIGMVIDDHKRAQNARKTQATAQVLEKGVGGRFKKSA